MHGTGGLAFGVDIVTKGSGTENNPYIVNNKEQLEFLSYLVSAGNTFEGKYIKLENNIVLDSTKNWIPIGNSTTNFNGKFDGNGKTISGININNSLENQGLFGILGTNSTIKNLTLNGSIIAGSNVGGIAGHNYGTIEGCINNASVTSGWSPGGITGINHGIIYKCINTATIYSRGEAAGGIVGVNAQGGGVGYVIECKNEGYVSADSWTMGGITACNTIDGGIGIIANCYNTGTIRGHRPRGGIVAQVKCRGGDSYVYNCYNKGDTEGWPDIVGDDWGSPGGNVQLNCYGASTATVEKLNVQSNIETHLQNTGLYRYDAWKLKNGEIVLSWE